MTDWPEFIAETMKAEKVTTRGLSEACGIPRSTICRYINGKTEIAQCRLEAILMALGYEMTPTFRGPPSPIAVTKFPDRKRVY